MTEQTIKRLLDVDVDGLKGIVTYKITEMYDLIDDKGYATIKFRTIDEFTMAWKEIEEEEKMQGHSMKTEIYKVYGIAE
ncbi:hypothetical protein [Sporosarcina sp. FSL W7-1283]|uniref:hypothetical protein n=1 Tax=Sporosarcina sp. FSL W7-1283 TaxID=2921560 RepID=UPI0030F7D67E